MKIRPTTPLDLPLLLCLFQKARSYMARHGNPHQWVNRPTPADLIHDITTGHSYVCEDGGQIVGTFAYLPGPDPTYATLYDGTWPDDAPYGVIHRLAGSAHHHGVAAAAFAWAFGQCDRLRIDTHADNHIMQRILQREGFTRCGTILIDDGSPRIAYCKRCTAR